MHATTQTTTSTTPSTTIPTRTPSSTTPTTTHTKNRTPRPQTTTTDRGCDAAAGDEATEVVRRRPGRPPARTPATTTSTTTSARSGAGIWRRLEGLVTRGAVALFAPQDRGLKRLPIGQEVLDEVLEGGLPRGRIAEIYGPPGAGKTSLALRLCRTTMAAGGVAAFVDADHGLERSTLARAGVDADRLVIARPAGGEDALQIVDELLGASAADVIVVDSVAALVPRAELATMTGSAPAGHHARLMSQALRRLTLQAARARAVVVFTNQLRRSWGEDGVGVDVTTGGHALPYAAATRLSITKQGRSTRVLVTKARFGREGCGTLFDAEA
jgi:RecA/RadA recombinase